MHTPLTSGTIKLNELSFIAFPVISHILLLHTSDNVIVFSDLPTGLHLFYDTITKLSEKITRGVH